MKLKMLVAFIAAIPICISTPATAGSECAAETKGPGLIEVNLVDQDDGEKVGTLEVSNTSEVMKFVLQFDDKINTKKVQLYIGEQISDAPEYKGKPNFGKFPYQIDDFEFDKGSNTFTLIQNLKDDLLFYWRGKGHRWDFMVHGEYNGGSFNAQGSCYYNDVDKYTYVPAHFFHPKTGHFIDSPVRGLSYAGPTQRGVTGYGEDGEPIDQGGFLFFPGEEIEFSIGNIRLGHNKAPAAQRVSPLDLFTSGDLDHQGVINVARVLQTLDSDYTDGKIDLSADAIACFELAVLAAGDGAEVDWMMSDDDFNALLDSTKSICDGLVTLAVVEPDEAQGNLEAGLNASNIFRKNVSKTEDWGETKQKLEVMPVYFPGLRSNGDPSLCVDVDGDKVYDEEDGDLIGVPYEEWRLTNCTEPDPLSEACECDPRLFEDAEACQVTLIECRQQAKPILATYMAKVDIFDDQVKEEFWPGRFSWDIFTAISRDDGTTWKRRNVSRMADMSSFDLETGEPFPGTVGTPYLKVNDNKILTVWQSKFCKSGNPRYSINLCDDPATEEVEQADNPSVNLSQCTGPGEPFECCTGPGEGTCSGCAIYCRGNPDHDTEVCDADYDGDDDYFVTDIWGVRGSQGSVDYNEVDDVAELGIGEIPYSCLWAARGVIASQKDLDEGVFASMNIEDDLTTIASECTGLNEPYECCTGVPENDIESCDESAAVQLGDIIWFKPERLTSGRRDAYLPVIGSARGAGFAIAWQEDPSGLRPGKGKGPGEGWSGAITNHKSDMWYSFISYDDFNIVDEDFEARGPGGGTDAEPEGDEGFIDKPGLGRPKALVPFSLPVRITDNDMVNTHTLKVEESTDCPDFPDHVVETDPDGNPVESDPVCFPKVVDGSFVPVDPEEIAAEFCGYEGDLPHDPTTCCDPDNHEGDPNCEDLKGFFGNLTGTKRYAYMASTIDELDNETRLYVPGGGGDGTPDYQYYMDRGGILDLCDLSGENSFFAEMPGDESHQRWFGFTNTNGVDKLVCVSSDGRLIDGDVYASRPMLQLQPYTKTVQGDNPATEEVETSYTVKSAWALFAYEESKGLGHSLAAAEHEDTDNPVDDIVAPDEANDDSGQDKPIKQDIGKNMIYHSFDFAEPDLVAPGHIVNLPALCGGLYPKYCDDRKTPDYDETLDHLNNPTCTCTAGEPVPLYFDYLVDTDGDPETPSEWIPDDTKFLQYRYEIARRARFLMQSPGKMGASNTLGAIIYKQGQEGQGRPADAFIRRFVKSGSGNPYKFENIQCTKYLDESFDLPGCPTDGVVGYNCNIWGEAYGDRLCGGVIDATTADGVQYTKRDHINLTSADVDLAVGTPVDDTPDDLTDDVYNRHKVLLWSQHEYNLGDESYGYVSPYVSETEPGGLPCDVLNGEACPGMYSNVRSHRGFIRGDFFVTAYALSPNWAAGRNGNDRYNFYVRKSFDGGQTWTTTPTDKGGVGVYLCPEFRTDPYLPDPDGSGNLPPQELTDVYTLAGVECGEYADVPEGEVPPEPAGIGMVNYLDPMSTNEDGVHAQFIGAGEFEPARNVSEIKNNHESSGDPRLGTTPPTYPLDGEDPAMPNLCPKGVCKYVEDTYVNNMFFVAWGTVDNAKSTGSSGVKAEAGPLDLYYTRSEDYGDNFVKVPWEVNGANSNYFGEINWRYDFVAKGDPEEQGECQLRATSDGSKAYVIWHSQISAEEDPNEEYTRFYPWKPSESYENDLWFRRLIFWPEDTTTVEE